jgi:hypothetical protein
MNININKFEIETKLKNVSVERLALLLHISKATTSNFVPETSQ